MALQIDDAACVLGTVSYRGAFEAVYYILLFFLNTGKKQDQCYCLFEDVLDIPSIISKSVKENNI